MTKSSEKSLIDMDYINFIFDHETVAIQQFFANFIEMTTVQLKDLETAIQIKDAELTKQLLHVLKGSAGTSGLPEMHTLCVDAETKTLEKDWKAVEAKYREIVNMFERVKSELSSR